MTELLVDPFSAPYLQRALIEAVLLGALAGCVGVQVVLRRLTFVADTFTHTVFPGLAVAFALGGSLFLGALVAGLISAVTFTLLDRNRRIPSDAALAVVLSSFFAVGVIVVSRTDRYTADLTSLLFGRILTVDAAQIAETAAVALLVAAVLVGLHKELVLRAFDPSAAEAMGYRIGAIDLLINVLVVLVVVASARAVGTLLTVALLIVPAAAAQLVCRSVAAMYLMAGALGALAGWLGLAATFEVSLTHGWRVAAGAMIVLVLVGLFALVLAGRGVARAWRRRRPVDAVSAAPAGALR